MVLKARGRLYRRKDGKYLIYIPKNLAQDSQFPFSYLQPGEDVKIDINANTVQKLIIINESEENGE